MIHIRLVTIQPAEILTDIIKNQLTKNQRFACNRAKADTFEDPCIRKAYDWMANQMAKRVGPAPRGVKYPIWAWYRHDDNYGYWNYDGKVYAKLTLEIDESRVLLSDFDEWHCVLNDCPCLAEDEEYEDREYSEDEKRESWSHIFHSDGECVQATFWLLKAEDIVEIELFTSTTEESE